MIWDFYLKTPILNPGIVCRLDVTISLLKKTESKIMLIKVLNYVETVEDSSIRGGTHPAPPPPPTIAGIFSFGGGAYTGNGFAVGSATSQAFRVNSGGSDGGSGSAYGSTFGASGGGVNSFSSSFFTI
ncbi:hypothetical protein Xen7305DRAFT_00035340 [Xenococcus sp. PCC 7305]|nr:hypothetical protein Xen7305DRAFT_00035340 [Xenococcus sp. PCC 7305]